jgi:hypothetical protein
MRGSDRRRIEVTSAAIALLTAFGCIYLLAPLHLQTVDGRLDTVVPGEFRWDSRADGEWAWGFETPVMDLASLRSITGPVDGSGASTEAATSVG